MFPPQTKLDPQGYYARLGLDRDASAEAIAAAFRRQARLLHPDVHGTGDADAFVAAKQAYDVLADPGRRAAYDRLARQGASKAEAPGEEAVVPAAAGAYTGPEEPPIRQPRWSDLPVFVWAGLAAILLIGAVQVVLHLRAEPKLVQTEYRPNAPIVPPANPASVLAAARAAAPVRLPGNVNAYVLPAAGPAVVWREDEQRNTLVPIGRLPAFSAMQAVRMSHRNGLVEVRITETSTGLVEASRLTHGDLAAARQAYCAYNAGPPPYNGELLAREGAGPAKLALDNHTTQPAVVKLRDETGAVALSVYLAPGGHADVDGLPNARFQTEFAIGEMWSRACGGFAAGMRAQRMVGFRSLDRLMPLVIPPEAPGGPPEDITDQAFERR